MTGTFLRQCSDNDQDSYVVEGQIDAWIDTYCVCLAGDQFDEFIKIRNLELDKEVAAAEKVWTIEFDRFDQFTYRKAKKRN